MKLISAVALLLLFSLSFSPAWAQEGGTADVASDELSEGISTDCETGLCTPAHVNSDILTETPHRASLQAKGYLGNSTRPVDPGSNSKASD